jgi:hypothetical protein
MGKINWLAIVVSVVAGSIIGFLWYGLFFMDVWAAGNSLTFEGDKIFKNGAEIPANSSAMAFNTLSMVVYAFFLHWLINKTGDKTWKSGTLLGLVIGLVNWVAIFVSNNFSHADGSLTLIDGSYALVLWTVMAGIIGGWRKDV